MENCNAKKLYFVAKMWRKCENKRFHSFDKFHVWLQTTETKSLSGQDTRPVGVPLEEPLTRVLNPRTDKHPPGPEHALQTHSQKSGFN